MLLHRLETDPVLAQFRSQFVPLKVETSGVEWAKWVTKYPYEGRGIPIIYVIRADGEKMYGKSGALPRQELPQMMIAALQTAGRSFDDAEYAVLSAAVDQAKKALEDNDRSAAIKTLGGLNKVGRLGEIGSNSHSIVAKEADELAKKVFESGRADIEDAKAKLADQETAFVGMLALVEAQRVYSVLPELNKAVTTVMRDVAKDSTLEPTLKQAETLARARLYASQKFGSSKRRAVTAYEQIITRYPGTPADKLARDELAKIAPDSEVLASVGGGTSPPSATAEYRVWTDSTGRYKTEAVLVAIQGGKAQLKKRDGQIVTLPLERLSAADRDYLRNRQPF